MTFERKIIVGLEEIKALVFQCNECEARTVIPIGKLSSIPTECPTGHSWDANAAPDSPKSPYFAFMFSLKRLMDPQYEKAARFKIFLELEEPKS